mgnify:CR=1 FL=1
MKKKRQKIWIGIVVVVVLLALSAVVVFRMPTAPAAELKLARKKLADAQESGADIYTPKLYNEAQQCYDSAMIYWSVQNERFFLNREYSKVKEQVDRSIQKATEASGKAHELKEKTSSFLVRGMKSLNQKVSMYEQVYKKMPLPDSVTEAYNRGKLKLAECRVAYEAGRLTEARKNYDQAEQLIGNSINRSEQFLNQWFVSYPQWKKNGNEAIRLSRGGKKVILVDKYAHRCVVYQNGQIIKAFDAELGINWMGDKRLKGDKATPEGIYRVIQKKDRQHTRFHQALLINYPNDEDKRRIATEKKNGTLARLALPGGLIEIHGHGGKGVNWTDGCVALKNEDMEILFRLVEVGTPVVIVGSLKSLAEIHR